jgi:hypothetical protein
MVTFYCDGCGALVFFESVTCVSCGRALGFLPDVMSMTALEPAGDVWKSLADGSQGKLYRACANGRDYGVCNWYVPIAIPPRGTMSAEPGKAMAAGATFDTVLDNWFPLTYALNSLNRGPRPSRPLPVRPFAEGDREAAPGPRGDHRGPRGAGSGPRMMAGCPA